jgi:hypothetical protein
MSNNYEYKYSKYKNKYLSLKNEMKGGDSKILTQAELNEVLAVAKLYNELKKTKHGSKSMPWPSSPPR